jgi:hypothetical protein
VFSGRLLQAGKSIFSLPSANIGPSDLC